MNHSGVEALLSKKKEIIKIIKAMSPVILLEGVRVMIKGIVSLACGT